MMTKKSISFAFLSIIFAFLTIYFAVSMFYSEFKIYYELFICWAFWMFFLFLAILF